MDGTSDGDTDKVIEVVVPGRAALAVRHLVLDLNGTLALDGRVLAGIPERVTALREHLRVHILTAGSHGHVEEATRVLGLQPIPISSGEEKSAHVRALGPETVAAMGNGANDVLMLREAALAIAVLGPEGLCPDALRAADVVVGDPCAGLDLLLYPTRLVATLRP